MNAWNQLVGASPRLAAYVSEVSAGDKPDFVLRETQSSTLRTFGEAGGVTQFLNSQGREVAAGPGAQITSILSQVSIADLYDPTARAIMEAGGESPDFRKRDGPRAI